MIIHYDFKVTKGPATLSKELRVGYYYDYIESSFTVLR